MTTREIAKKLTPARYDLLRGVHRLAPGGYSVYSGYKPAVWLVDHNLCRMENGKLGSSWLYLTDLGIAVLAELDKGETK